MWAGGRVVGLACRRLALVGPVHGRRHVPSAAGERANAAARLGSEPPPTSQPPTPAPPCPGRPRVPPQAAGCHPRRQGTPAAARGTRLHAVLVLWLLQLIVHAQQVLALQLPLRRLVVLPHVLAIAQLVRPPLVVVVVAVLAWGRARGGLGVGGVGWGGGTQGMGPGPCWSQGREAIQTGFQGHPAGYASLGKVLPGKTSGQGGHRGRRCKATGARHHEATLLSCEQLRCWWQRAIHPASQRAIQ